MPPPSVHVGASAVAPHTRPPSRAPGPRSFRDPVRYELGRRGLVVVTGQVHDTAEAGEHSCCGRRPGRLGGSEPGRLWGGRGAAGSAAGTAQQDGPRGEAGSAAAPASRGA